MGLYLRPYSCIFFLLYVFIFLDISCNFFKKPCIKSLLQWRDIRFFRRLCDFFRILLQFLIWTSSIIVLRFSSWIFNSRSFRILLGLIWINPGLIGALKYCESLPKSQLYICRNLGYSSATVWSFFQDIWSSTFTIAAFLPLISSLAFWLQFPF